MPGPFPYLNNIPQPTDQLSVSQGNLLTNFQAIQNLIDVDHADFATVNAGKHNQVTMPAQSPQPTFSGTDLGMYAFAGGGTGLNEIYLHKLQQAGLGTVDFPMTGSILSTANPLPIAGSAGWSYLPSGLIIKWACVNVAATTTQTLIFPVAGNIPAFTVCLNVSVTGLASDGTKVYASLVSFSNTQLQASISALGGGTNSICYFAIGY